MKLFGIVILTMIASCNLEVNTTDSQASTTIRESKKNKMFVEQVSVLEDSCGIREAWIENIWKNTFETESGKERLGGDQLVVRLNFNKVQVDPYKYLFDWKLVSKELGTFGGVNGVCIAELDIVKIPDVITVELIKGDSNRICEFRLKID